MNTEPNTRCIRRAADALPWCRVPWRIGLIVAELALVPASVQAGPVVLEFRLPADAAAATNPLEREIFGDVRTPSGGLVRLPAFPAGAGVWRVHARADQAGQYRIQQAVEQRNGAFQQLAATFPDPDARTVDRVNARRPVARDARDSTRFAFSDGKPYVPIGANLAWAAGKRVAWHLDAFRQFEAHQLNWTRIWMAHWGGTNLDWLPEDMGPSPAPGTIDARVAENWDALVEAAETHGVYVQVVLQHHGQFTTGANTNWATNPWNAAHPGGFLEKPSDFFTSPRAIALTKHKYRTIVARWAHSPAILAWELFNEVHWTNGYQESESAVAAWHAEMARYLRSIDPYDHLVTTSLDDVRSPIYAAMDYFQPHLYAVNMLTGVRAFELPFGDFDRPVFFGEIGDDKMPVTEAEKHGGSQLVPQVWASLMGPGSLPSQSWLGEVFLRTGRVGELGAVSRFLRDTGLPIRHGLVPFSPAAEAQETMPLTVLPAYDWARHRRTHVSIPLDGSDSLETNHIPGILVGSPSSVAEGYPSEFTLELAPPAATRMRVIFADAGVRGATVEIAVEDAAAVAHTWPRLPGAPATGPQPPDAPRRPASLSVPVPAGPHRITIRNTGGEDWVRIDRIELDVAAPVLAAAGKRGENFLALWIWNKRGVHALNPVDAAAASFLIPEVPAGRWKVTWWDADRGEPGEPAVVDHPGGTWRLATPPIARHAAVVLTR